MKKELPNSQLLEQSLLGSLFIYPQVLSQCRDRDLKAGEFYVPGHQKIFESMLEVYQEGHPIDVNQVVNRLNDKEILQQCGGTDYLNSLLNQATSSSNAINYISTIKNKAQLRSLIAACENISEKSFDGEEDIDHILDHAERSIMEVTRTRRGAEFETYSTVAGRVMTELESMKDQNGVTGLKTGFRDLDTMTSGLHPGDLIILAARPAMGKSAFALNLASNVAAKNQEQGAVAIFSLEMPSESLIKRMLSCEARIESEKLRNGRLSNDELNQLYRSANLMSTLKIFIDDTSSIQVSQIFSKCRKLKSENDQLALIVIDYLQLISGSKGSDSRQQEVSEISRNLKILAKEMNCPVVALSQLSRKVEERNNHEPMLSDLRESGSIEQDADIVMFLYRESYYDNDKAYFSEDGKEDMQDVVDLSIAKHRNGSTGKIRLIFEKEYSAFSSADLRTGLNAV